MPSLFYVLEQLCFGREHFTTYVAIHGTSFWFLLISLFHLFQLCLSNFLFFVLRLLLFSFINNLYIFWWWFWLVNLQITIIYIFINLFLIFSIFEQGIHKSVIIIARTLFNFTLFFIFNLYIFLFFFLLFMLLLDLFILQLSFVFVFVFVFLLLFFLS